MRTLSPEWNELTKFAIQEADRLGIELAFENCAGWSTSGGPWVTPEQSMQFVYWSKTNVAGGSDVDVALPKGKDSGDYNDIAVLAFPTPRGDGDEGAAAVTASEMVAGLIYSKLFMRSASGWNRRGFAGLPARLQ